jgi:hypothetical protein
MVQADELRRLKRQEPFHPFRVHLKDGRAYEVRYPKITLVADAFITIGFPALGDTVGELYDKTVTVPYWYITRVELVEEPAAPEK